MQKTLVDLSLSAETLAMSTSEENNASRMRTISMTIKARWRSEASLRNPCSSFLLGSSAVLLVAMAELMLEVSADSLRPCEVDTKSEAVIEMLSPDAVAVVSKVLHLQDFSFRPANVSDGGGGEKVRANQDTSL